MENIYVKASKWNWSTETVASLKRDVLPFPNCQKTALKSLPAGLQTRNALYVYSSDVICDVNTLQASSRLALLGGRYCCCQTGGFEIDYACVRVLRPDFAFLETSQPCSLGKQFYASIINGNINWLQRKFVMLSWSFDDTNNSLSMEFCWNYEMITFETN